MLLHFRHAATPQDHTDDTNNTMSDDNGDNGNTNTIDNGNTKTIDNDNRNHTNEVFSGDDIATSSVAAPPSGEETTGIEDNTESWYLVIEDEVSGRADVSAGAVHKLDVERKPAGCGILVRSAGFAMVMNDSNMPIPG